MIISLNDNWTFFKDTAAPAANQTPASNKAQAPAQASAQAGETVTLPHTWNAIDGQDGGSDYFRGECTYTRPLPALTLKEDEEAYLCFYGVSQTAEIFVNGELVTRHEGGYSRFYADVTRFFRTSSPLSLASPCVNGAPLPPSLRGVAAKQTEGVFPVPAQITVRVSNAASDRVYPQAADFTFFGGIYRSVELLIVNRSHFDLTSMGGGVKITPKENGGAWSTELTPYVTHAENLLISWRIFDGRSPAASANSSAQTPVASAQAPAAQTVNIAIPDPVLWQGVDDPHLYTLEAVLLSPEGKLLDTFTARFGLRTFSIDPERGFILNGKSYPLRGVSRHQDRENMGYAITRREHEEDLALIRELGANSVRLAHYQHDDYFYSLCDEAGLVVWAEVPYITMELKEGHENILSQFRELITQNYNHTCIVCWGLSNEITLKGVTDGIVQTHAALKAIKEELDPYRPSTMAHISMLSPDSPFVETADICAWNLYFGWYEGSVSQYKPWLDKFHATHPELPVGLSEYGADALVAYQSAQPAVGDVTESYQEYYHEKVLEQIEKMPYLWCTYVWNMFDFAADAREEGGDPGKNHKGLVTYDRKTRKDAFYVYKARWSREPFVHLAGRRYVYRHEATTSIRVYTNLPKVSLYVDQKLFAEQEGRYLFSFDVPISGKHTVEARAEGCSDAIEIEHVAAPFEGYRCKAKEGAVNWLDGCSEEGFVVTDRIGDILAVPEGKEFLNAFFAYLIEKRRKTGAPVREAEEGLIEGMADYTVERVMNMVGDLLSEREQIHIVRALNRVKKP